MGLPSDRGLPDSRQRLPHLPQLANEAIAQVKAAHSPQQLAALLEAFKAVAAA
ncbi:MAG: hypothetical protein JNM65_02670 [Verrucomicrobiaceae bacterium]|nr:hypothetical protein [Verrucomicrobiaceae bacterium]